MISVNQKSKETKTMKEEKKEKDNPLYEILESFNGHTGDFKPFKFEEGKQTDKTSLILTGWDNRNIRFMLETNMLKQVSEKDPTKFIDTNKIKEILLKPKEKKDSQIIKEEKTEKQFQYSFSTINCAEDFIDKAPMFYDKSKLWWVWNKERFFWEGVDETDLLNKYLNVTGDVEITLSKKRTEILHALQMVGRLKEPKPAKTKYIQFRDKVVNIEDGKIHPVENRFFFTNPIPWEIGNNEETPVIDNLFKEWVGEKYVKTLYEIIAYCCLRNYPIQVLFCFVGGGRNGKSQFQKILIKFLGTLNTCSTELDPLLNNRFESFKLYKKLACSLGETNFGILNNTSLLKKLTGGDLIGFEKKNKDPFDEYNYAKILINSNSLPTSQDTSDGFYRRWVIIDFPNEFPEGKDIVETIPEIEYNNLCKKVIRILSELIERGNFTNQGTIEERKQKYIEVSNPLDLFLNSFCSTHPELWIRDTKLYSAYSHYLTTRKRRVVTKKEFYDFLSHEGFERRRTTKTYPEKIGSDGYPLKETGWFYEGIAIDDEKNAIYVKNANILTREPLCKDLNSKTQHLSHKSHKEELIEETIPEPKSSLEIVREQLIDLQNTLKPVPVEELIKRCIIYDVDELAVDSAIEHLKKKGDVTEPKAGFVQSL